MNKKDNDILARDLVLAAFIVMKRMYESRDAGRAGKLQMFLNVHAGSHGDVKNIVARLNNPKSTVNLSEDQKRIYQRALDIVESLSESETGWVAQQIEKLEGSGEFVSIPFSIPIMRVLYQNSISIEGYSLDGMAKIINDHSKEQPELHLQNPALSWVKVDLLNMPQDQIEELQRLLRFEPSIGKYTLVQDLPDPFVTSMTSGLSDNSIWPDLSDPDNETRIPAGVLPDSVLATTEQPKAKPGRKPRNPIEAAAAGYKNKGKACCN